MRPVVYPPTVSYVMLYVPSAVEMLLGSHWVPAFASKGYFPLAEQPKPVLTV
jgi:hypothetical protein